MKASVLFFIFSFFICTSCNNHQKDDDSEKWASKEEIARGLDVIQAKGNLNVGSSLWTDSTKELQITRISSNGFYKYLFWKKELERSRLYYSDSIAHLDYLNDSLYDVNGDGDKDFVVNIRTRNGQCQPKFALLYCFDRSKNLLSPVDQVLTIPNPEFDPSTKTVVSVIECLMIREVQKFKWNGLLLDTVYIKTDSLR